MARIKRKRKTMLALLAITLCILQFDLLFNLTSILSKDPNIPARDCHMSLINENAVYYHYYRHVIAASSISRELDQLFSDKRFTYLDPVNGVKKSNIWPEIIIAMLYKAFSPSMTPLRYYITLEIALHAAILTLVLLTTALLSSRILMGLVGCAVDYSGILFSTRLPVALMLRKNFGLPMLTMFYSDRYFLGHLVFVKLYIKRVFK